MLRCCLRSGINNGNRTVQGNLMFLKRSSKPELMDDFALGDQRIETALKELHLINRFLGGITVSEKGIRKLLDNHTSATKILDVGGGGSDVLSDLNEKYPLNIFSLDLNKYSCQYQKNQHPDHQVTCADALQLPFKTRSFDIVHASLFLHHFSEAEIIRLLKHFRLISNKGVIINDLRRNVLAYTGIKLLSMMFSRSTFVKNDGPLSVLRSFTKNDLDEILSSAGIKKYVIRRMWAFRFLVLIEVDEDG